MARVEHIQVINDYGSGGNIARRTSKTGKQRVTTTIRSEPILINTDPKALGRPVVEAIKEHLKQRVGDISAPAKPSTVRKREYARRALMRGEQWAYDRYSGGRMGTLVPFKSDRLFNDSGRLRESISVGATNDGWVVNIAANRFDPTTLHNPQTGTGGEAALVRILAMLKQFIPEWGDARELTNVLSVQRAIRTGLAGAIEKATARTAELKKQLMSQGLGIARQVIGIAG